jgi:hypothetical protein
MKKLILVIALGVNGFGFGQTVSTAVYAVGADEVSFVLQRGIGERIVFEYRLESTVGSDKIIAAIKTQMKNPSIDLRNPFGVKGNPTINGKDKYSKLNTEIVFESNHIIFEGWNAYTGNANDQWIADSLYRDFKNSKFELDPDEHYLVIIANESHFRPGTPITSTGVELEENILTSHVVLKIRRVLR